MTEEDGRDAADDADRDADDADRDADDADRDADDADRDADDADRPTMGDVSHTNPYTNETFGGIYRRGPALADGGAEPKAVGDDGAEPAPVDGDADGSADADSADRTQTMGEIDHTPRDLNVNNVWDRGDSGFVPGDD